MLQRHLEKSADTETSPLTNWIYNAQCSRLTPLT